MGEESTRSELDPIGGPGGRRTIRQMVVFGLIATAIGIAAGLAIDWFPEAGSTQADKIDSFWDVLIITSVPFFVLVVTVVLFAVRDFRMRPGDEHRDGPPIHGNTKLEVIWTAIPAILLVGLCAYAFVILEDMEEAPAKQPERVVKVTGEQFTWTFEYDEGGKKFKTAQLYLPVGESVKFDVVTKDVLHDFWVPAFRMKIDAVPGITTNFRVTPTKEGRFPVVCAELCGLGHAVMRQTAHVLPPEEFAAWVEEQGAAGESGATAGSGASPAGQETGNIDAKALFNEGNAAGATACSGCHTLADAGANGTIGPNLDEVLAGQGAEAIEQSIVDPGAEITEGFQNIMPPNYGDTLNERELAALAAYLDEVTK